MTCHEVLCSITRTTLTESCEMLSAEGSELALRDESLRFVPSGGLPRLVGCLVVWTTRTQWSRQSLRDPRWLKNPLFHLYFGVTERGFIRAGRTPFLGRRVKKAMQFVEHTPGLRSPHK